eukprot:CAMPEP_0118684762 /NCGR_PEP_ID=MMETSP0800-20121206/6841_1 /TAXON_ID=210618 ORGANISM="Striatella unipunctata, Strain CCMP2910" /NCGR_SAMPLE_ID=MMETSP0800 /ASSEMBLY_ACC=CAM_ASM_000638 /LENGTH=250 /DNA_ID=CAMNT_0006581539 /DNA_START=58 /DNA_END=810 /DNA_ORIENTATION=+
MPNAPAARRLGENDNLLRDGFLQIFRTIQKVNQSYKAGLRWFLLALVFAEAAINTFTTLAVVFLTDQLKFSATQNGMFFLITLMGVFPGGFLIGNNVTSSTNPKTSWILSQIAIFIVGAVGVLVLQEDGPFAVALVWGFFVGLCFGWFYPAENLFFSMCLPKGQEAELSGFYVYCTQILGWLPPLVFSILVQNDVAQNYGIIVVCCFFLPSLAILSIMTGTWIAANNGNVSAQGDDQLQKTADVNEGEGD